MAAPPREVEERVIPPTREVVAPDLFVTLIGTTLGGDVFEVTLPAAFPVEAAQLAFWENMGLEIGEYVIINQGDVTVDSTIRLSDMVSYEVDLMVETIVENPPAEEVLQEMIPDRILFPGIFAERHMVRLQTTGPKSKIRFIATIIRKKIKHVKIIQMDYGDVSDQILFVCMLIDSHINSVYFGIEFRMEGAVYYLLKKVIPVTELRTLTISLFDEPVDSRQWKDFMRVVRDSYISRLVVTFRVRLFPTFWTDTRDMLKGSCLLNVNLHDVPFGIHGIQDFRSSIEKRAEPFSNYPTSLEEFSEQNLNINASVAPDYDPVINQAIRFENVELVEQCVNAGAKLLHNGNGETPLDVASHLPDGENKDRIMALLQRMSPAAHI